MKRRVDTSHAQTHKLTCLSNWAAFDDDLAASGCWLATGLRTHPLPATLLISRISRTHATGFAFWVKKHRMQRCLVRRTAFASSLFLYKKEKLIFIWCWERRLSFGLVSHVDHLSSTSSTGRWVSCLASDVACRSFFSPFCTALSNIFGSWVSKLYRENLGHFVWNLSAKVYIYYSAVRCLAYVSARVCNLCKRGSRPQLCVLSPKSVLQRTINAAYQNSDCCFYIIAFMYTDIVLIIIRTPKSCNW